MPLPTFDPDKIIGDYSFDYYKVLKLERGCLPAGINRQEKQQISNILERAYRENARYAHPDFGGTEESFKTLVRAHTILSDPLLRRIYESGGRDRPTMAEEGFGFDIDWSKLGTYRKGTTADTTGYGLFFQLTERKQELDIVPAFFPEDEAEHSYEWDWAIPDKNSKLSLALVHDESDVLRLTGGEQVSSSLPFKIYFCIPRSALQFIRSDDEHFTHDDGTVDIMPGHLRAAAYSDYNLLETTSLEEAREFISFGGGLEKALKEFRDGILEEKQVKIDQENFQTQSMSSEKMQQMDIEVLKSILRAKSQRLTPNEHAADFLQDLPEND